VKGPRELKRYVAKYREHLRACRWDDLVVMRLELCKKFFSRARDKQDLRRNGGEVGR
jgi:hypothetical protein